MDLGLWLGAVLVVSGGALQGAFAVPMKYARNWQHEHIWLVFAATGLVLFPWAVTVAAVPFLSEVYRATPPKLLAFIIASGIGWGVGAVLVGIGFRMLGIGLAFAIILGLSALLGSLVPFLIQTPEKWATAQGHLYLMGTFVMLVGIGIVSAAGSLRERAERATHDPAQPGRQRFVAGLLVAIVAGVLSSLLSDAIAFGGQVVDTARQFGASTVWAAGTLLALATTGGFLPNLLFCAHQMRRHHNTRLFWLPSARRYWLYGCLMGAFWYGGLAIYGLGEKKMGSVVGWPLFIGAMILSSSGAGLLTGEWASAGRRAKAYLFVGSLIIFLALIIVSMAHHE